MATWTAAGTVPDDVFFNRYVNVYALPTSVVDSCPLEFTVALNAAYASADQGGETVAHTMQVDGQFSVPVVWQPTQPGRFLLCGYLHEGVDTLATATADVSVDEAVTQPVNTSRPRVVVSRGRLVCKRGSWTGAPTFRYAWQVDGRLRPRLTGPRIRITRALRGTVVRCRVRATNEAGSTVAWTARKRVPR